MEIVSEAVSNAPLLFVVLAVLLGAVLVRRWRFRAKARRFVEEDVEFCIFCGSADVREHQTCPECGYCAAAIGTSIPEQHLELLRLFADVEDSLRWAYHRAGGGAAMISNLLRLPLVGVMRGIKIRNLTSGRDRLEEATSEYLDGLDRLVRGIDDHSALLSEIEDPETGEDLETLLVENFEVSDPVADGWRAQWRQALLSKRIGADLERLQRAREALVADDAGRQ